MAWRSDLAACLIARGDAYGLKAGFADYWVARPTVFGGSGAVQLEEMTPKGLAQVYGSDAFGLLRSSREAGQAALFNYIVTTNLDEAALQARYGAPSQTFQCEGLSGQGDGEVGWIAEDGGAGGAGQRRTPLKRQGAKGAGLDAGGYRSRAPPWRSPR